MKRVISTFLAFALLLGMMSMMVYATDDQAHQDVHPLKTIDDQAGSNVVASGTCGDNLTWVLDDGGTLKISGDGPMDNYNGYGKPSPWHSYRYQITEVVIADGVASIGAYAFYEHSYLELVYIPDSVTSIPAGDGLRTSAFYGANAMFYCETISQPGGWGTYWHDGGNICWGSTKEEYDYWTSVDTSGTTFVIQDGITIIPYKAFYNCTNLTSITIPDSITRIDFNAFDGCTRLNQVHISDLESWCNIAFDSETSNPIYYAGRLYLNGELVTEIEIPEGIVSVGSYSFYGCTSLEQVVIPDNVTTIGYQAFRNCTSLSNVVIPDSVTEIGGHAFQACAKLTSVTIPDSVTSIGYRAFYGCNQLAEVHISDLESWCNIAFDSETSNPIYYAGRLYLNGKLVTEVEIPDGVNSIGAYSFCGCVSLKTVIIPDSVISLGEQAFDGCSNLVNVTIPYGVNSIETWTFRNCTSLKSISIPDSVVNNNFRFNGCSNLETIALPNGISELGYYMFSGCGSLKNINIPKSVTTIGNGAFSQCSSLEKITIPDSVTKIILVAFSGCSNLSDIYFCGDAPYFDSRVFPGVTATAYYPEGNETWTDEVMQDYGGDITWVPYDPNSLGGGDDGGDNDEPPVEEPVDPPCTLEELTTLDYLAFAQIAYMDFESDGTVKDCLTAMGYWDSYWDEDRQITYAELCEHIAQWKVAYSYISNLSSINGFYAVPFENANNEVVLAYRGSVPPDKIPTNQWDAYCDWIKNDLPIELNNTLGPQYTSALAIYNIVEGKWGKDNMTVTGHSLGGAWADVASAYSGCKGVTFNAVSVLDTVYNEKPEEMGKLFSGVDKWNFVDHTNKYDVLAGMFESYWSLNKIKPYTAHNSIYASTNIGGNHGLQSIVERDDYGNLRLTDTEPASNFTPSNVISNHLSFTQEAVDLGTSSNDTINNGLSVILTRSSFGGNGFDSIITSVRKDVLIGGRGDDELDGSFGDDIYAYYKGDGKDVITDIGGNDVLHLWGFAEDDTFEILDDEVAGFIDVKCNGSVITRIRNKNRHTINFFRIYIQRGDEITEHDITEHFNTKNFGSHVLIACPVEIQILDVDSNVVYTLQDGVVGNFYTDYGNFYVFEEEDGGYGKVLDLVEGYSAKIVGVDTGTMDITYQSVENGELSEVQMMSNIPVSTTFEGFLVEEDDGDAILKIVGDHNKDGVVNDEDQNHNWDDGVVSDEADCENNGQRTYTCIDCGATKTEPIESPGHDYKWKYDGVKHWQECGNCHNEQGEAMHSGGTATCTEKAVCAICETTYGALAQHDYEETWNQGDANGHWHDCMNCTAHDTVAPHIPGAAATETTAQTCTDCGFVIVPATGHITHTASSEWLSDGAQHWHKCTGCNEKLEIADHTGGTATCTEKAVCAICETTYGALAQHDYEETWNQGDANGHWHDCMNCTAHDTVAPHIPGAAATETTAQTCTDCGFVIVPATGTLDPEGTTQPEGDAGTTDPEKTPVPDNPKTGDDNGIVYYILSILCSFTCLVALLMLQKKMKYSKE